MPADFVITQGDNEPLLAEQLLDRNGNPVNITGASLALQLRALTALEPLELTGVVEIIDAPNGKVEWKPSTADAAVAGAFMGKWIVTYVNGAIRSYRTDGYLWVRIEPNVAAEPRALVSLPDVKDFLSTFGVDRTHDAKLLNYINAATPIIENVVGPVLVRTIEEWHAGGTTHISLRRKPSFALGTTPVLTLVAVSEAIGPIEWPLAIIATPDKGQLYSCMLNQRLGSVVRRTRGGGVQPYPENGGGEDVHVIYQVGQQTVPANVREATLEAIRQQRMQTMPTGTGSRSIVDAEPEAVGPGSAFAGLVDRNARQSLSPMKRFPSFA